MGPTNNVSPRQLSPAPRRLRRLSSIPTRPSHRACSSTCCRSSSGSSGSCSSGCLHLSSCSTSCSTCTSGCSSSGTSSSCRPKEETSTRGSCSSRGGSCDTCCCCTCSSSTCCSSGLSLSRCLHDLSLNRRKSDWFLSNSLNMNN